MPALARKGTEPKARVTPDKAAEVDSHQDAIGDCTVNKSLLPVRTAAGVRFTVTRRIGWRFCELAWHRDSQSRGSRGFPASVSSARLLAAVLAGMPRGLDHAIQRHVLDDHRPPHGPTCLLKKWQR
jgi:hypothetical protein